jgi:hypothetical protein
MHLDVRRTKFKGIFLHCRNTEAAWLEGGKAATMARKEKGPRGMAVQPKSREETPKVGTPWRVRTDHGAALDMGVFVLRCNLGPAPAAELWNTVAAGQREVGQMATLALGLSAPVGRQKE